MSRCIAITKCGNQCSRIAKKGSSTCYQHLIINTLQQPIKKLRLRQPDAASKKRLYQILKRQALTPAQEAFQKRLSKLESFLLERPDYFANVKRHRDNPYFIKNDYSSRSNKQITQCNVNQELGKSFSQNMSIKDTL